MYRDLNHDLSHVCKVLVATRVKLAAFGMLCPPALQPLEESFRRTCVGHAYMVDMRSDSMGPGGNPHKHDTWYYISLERVGHCCTRVERISESQFGHKFRHRLIKCSARCLVVI